MKYPQIAEEIIALKEADLQLRDELARSGQLYDGYNKQMETFHISNAKSLDAIINQIGYPTIDLVGTVASDAAWLIIQHSISLPPFVKKCHTLLKTKVDNGQANPINLAYLTDRILVFEDKPQLYGTQLDWDKEGNLSPQPFDNLQEVNQRRKTLGLNTLEEQIILIRERAKDEKETPPKDWNQRKQNQTAWKKAVGWLV